MQPREKSLKPQFLNKLHEEIQGKEHIIWDWNGTLLDDVGHAVSVMNTLLDEHGLKKIDREIYRNIFEFPVFNYYERLGFDFKKESFESLCHKFVDRFMNGFHTLPLIQNMKAVLVQLQEEKRMQSILSATDQDNLNSMILHFELVDIFHHVCGINNKFAGSKIESGHELIRISGVPKHKTVIIGDTLHDLEVGRELGIDTILISHGHQCPTILRKHHEKVVEL